jgi:hypothetical protein
MAIIGIMIDLLIFGMMVVKDGSNMVSIIEIMISQLLFILRGAKYGTSVVKGIEQMISQLRFGQMERCNIGLMGRRLNEYL